MRSPFFNWEEYNDEEQTNDEGRDALRTGPSCFRGTIPGKVKENKPWGNRLAGCGMTEFHFLPLTIVDVPK